MGVLNNPPPHHVVENPEAHHGAGSEEILNLK